MDPSRRSRAMLIASMSIFGTIGIFRRYIPLPSGTIALARGYVGALFLLLVTLFTGKRLNRKAIRSNLLLLCLSGAAMGFNWILLFEAYNYTSVATATLCYYMAPIFTILLSPLILHERLTGRKLLCILLSLLGMVMVSGVLDAGSSRPGELRGVLLGLGAAVLYTCVVLMNKSLRPISAYDKTILQLGSAALVLQIYVLFTGELSQLSFTPLSAVMLAIVCIVHTGLAYVLYFGSFERLPTHTLALFSYIDPVLAVLLSALLLHEPLTPFTLIGAVLILGSALYSELPVKQHRPG